MFDTRPHLILTVKFENEADDKLRMRILVSGNEGVEIPRRIINFQNSRIKVARAPHHRTTNKIDIVSVKVA
jgi:hypothetical protein